MEAEEQSIGGSAIIHPGRVCAAKTLHLKSEKVMTSTVREIEFPMMIGNHRRIIRLVAVFCSRF